MTPLAALMRAPWFARVMLGLCLLLLVTDTYQFVNEGSAIHAVLAFAMACCAIYYWNRLRDLRGER